MSIIETKKCLCEVRIMNENILESIDSFLNVFSMLKDTYKSQCSEISLKMAAFNISSCRRNFDFQKYKRILGIIDFTNNLEYKLIISSLYFSNFEDYDKKLEEYFNHYYSKLSILPSKNIHSLICGLIIISSANAFDFYTNKFTEVYNSIEKTNPLFNYYQYSPFILLASINANDKYSLTDISNEIYYALHDSGFARGTNSYCTSLYLSTLNKKIDTDKIREIYTNLQSLIPLNQFNYLSCAQLYVCDNKFSDYSCIIDIHKKISNEIGVKWFTEQLDIAITCAIYLKANNLNPLGHLDLGINECLSPGLLTTMIVSTILLNNELE